MLLSKCVVSTPCCGVAAVGRRVPIHHLSFQQLNLSVVPTGPSKCCQDNLKVFSRSKLVLNCKIMMCDKQGKSWPKLRSQFLQLGSIFCMYVRMSTYVTTVLQFPVQLIIPYAWDIYRRQQYISLSSREIMQYSPYYYSYHRALHKLGKNTAHNNDRRRVINYTNCRCYLHLRCHLQSPLPPHANI